MHFSPYFVSQFLFCQHHGICFWKLPIGPKDKELCGSVVSEEVKERAGAVDRSFEDTTQASLRTTSAATFALCLDSGYSTDTLTRRFDSAAHAKSDRTGSYKLLTILSCTLPSSPGPGSPPPGRPFFEGSWWSGPFHDKSCIPRVFQSLPLNH